MMRRMLSFCEKEHDWMVETIETLVRAESPSTDKAAADRCGAELQRRLEAIGCRVDRIRRDVSGDHLLAVIGSGDRQVLLLGHFDTVWPVGQLERMPLRRDGTRLYGPGTFDMKAGIVVGMQAIRALGAAGVTMPARVAMLLTSDEEIGSFTSREVVEDQARLSSAVLVLEPALPGGGVKTARKGCGEFEIVVRGVAAHAAAEPPAGASAIHELARQILLVQRLGKRETGVSVNVGRVSGGTRGNVVAEEARATVDLRVSSASDMPRLEAAMRSLKPRLRGTSVEVAGGFDRPPLERTAAVLKLYALARDVAAELGRDLAEGATGGGSDGNFTAALGVPTLDGLGALGGNAHAIDEHVDVGEIAWRAALVAGLLHRIARG
jgi:glutamate carboxypeptidase